MNPFLNIHPEVQEALNDGKAVVALESTIISHGMPYPKNVETAIEVENTVRANGPFRQPSQFSMAPVMSG